MKIRSQLSITMMAAVLGMVGCQKSNIVAESDGAQVQFSPYIGKSGAVTKGSPLEAFAVGDRFVAYAFSGTTPFFDGVTVTKITEGAGSTDAVWTYSPIKMWPANNSSLKFFAYAPINTDIIKPTITSASQAIAFEASADVSKHLDLIVAGTDAPTATSVSLTFKHVTSRVSIKAMKVVGVDDKDMTKVRISDVRIGNAGAGISSKGTYSSTDVTGLGTWGSLTTPIVYTPELDHGATVDLKTELLPITKASQSMFLIPQSLVGQMMLVDYEYSLDGGFAWTKYTATISLGEALQTILPGKHYSLNLKLSPSKNYQFAAVLEDWASPDAVKVPTSPLSTTSITTKKLEESFNVTYTPAGAPKKYTFKSSAPAWLKVGPRTGLSFTDAAVTDPYTYEGRDEPKAAGVSDPVQDWYIYLLPNNTGAARRATVTLTFEDTSVPPAILVVNQPQFTRDDNFLMATVSTFRIYSDAATDHTRVEASWLWSKDNTKTQGMQYEITTGLTMQPPAANVDGNGTGLNVSVNKVTFPAGGAWITAKNTNVEVKIFVQYYPGSELPGAANVRQLAGEFLEANCHPGVTTGFNVSFNRDGSNAAKKISSATPRPVYLVAEKNPGTGSRVVNIELKLANGQYTRDRYVQVGNNVAALPVTAEAGTVRVLGGNLNTGENFLTFTSTGAITNANFALRQEGNRSFQITNGTGAVWTTEAGGIRQVQVQCTPDTRNNAYLTLSVAGLTPIVIPVTFEKAIERSAFISGSYTSATVDSGDATVSNTQDDPGTNTLATVTNKDGVWIHYTETTGVRRSIITLTNATDWTKSTRVIAFQDGKMVNANSSLTDVERPAKFAGSNIYLDETGQPTFDDAGIRDHAKYRGVMFAWGGLAALAPNTESPTMLWKPVEFTGETNPYVETKPGSAYPYFTSQLTLYSHEPAAGKGDICRYMTEKGLAPANKKWRLPTSMELSSAAQKDIQSVYPAGFADDNISDMVDGKPGPKDSGRGIVEAGIVMAGEFFPASGTRYTLNNGPVSGLDYWSASLSARDYSSTASFQVNPQTLSSANHILPYLDSPYPYRYRTVRCVVDYEGLYGQKN